MARNVLVATYPKSSAVMMNGLKNPEIPLLASYKEEPKKEFWEAFPKAELPDGAMYYKSESWVFEETY